MKLAKLRCLMEEFWLDRDAGTVHDTESHSNVNLVVTGSYNPGQSGNKLFDMLIRNSKIGTIYVTDEAMDHPLHDVAKMVRMALSHVLYQRLTIVAFTNANMIESIINYLIGQGWLESVGDGFGDLYFIKTGQITAFDLDYAPFLAVRADYDGVIDGLTFKDENDLYTHKTRQEQSTLARYEDRLLNGRGPFDIEFLQDAFDYYKSAITTKYPIQDKSWPALEAVFLRYAGTILAVSKRLQSGKPLEPSQTNDHQLYMMLNLYMRELQIVQSTPTYRQLTKLHDIIKQNQRNSHIYDEDDDQ